MVVGIYMLKDAAEMIAKDCVNQKFAVGISLLVSTVQVWSHMSNVHMSTEAPSETRMIQN